jgi:hypothetical protein
MFLDIWSLDIQSLGIQSLDILAVNHGFIGMFLDILDLAGYYDSTFGCVQVKHSSRHGADFAVLKDRRDYQNCQNYQAGIIRSHSLAIARSSA